MNALQAIVMGIVQGLTEFLPVSSTGHLRIVPAFLGWEDPGAAFTAVTQLGTMAAVLVYFRKDLWGIAVAVVRGLFDKSQRATQQFRHGMYIIIGTVPICIFGVLLSDHIETGARNLYLIGTTLIVLGILLGLAERLGKRVRSLDDVRGKDAIVIGFAQAMALIPGVSRSGATMTAGMFLGFDRASAARFSFLLSVPAVVLSGLYELPKIGEHSDVSMTSTMIATLFAFISGWIAIAGLLHYLARHSVNVFVFYRVGLGALVIGLAASGTIQ